MKSLFVSFLLILCFGFTTQNFDQVDQGSKIVKDLQTHFEIGVIASGQELLPKIKAQSAPLMSVQKWTDADSQKTQYQNLLPVFPLSSFSNFISSGASLNHDLSRSFA